MGFLPSIDGIEAFWDLPSFRGAVSLKFFLSFSKSSKRGCNLLGLIAFIFSLSKRTDLVSAPALRATRKLTTQRLTVPNPKISSSSNNLRGIASTRALAHCRSGFETGRLVRCRAAADPAVSRPADNAPVVGVYERELLKSERELYGLRFAWVKSDSRETLESTYRLLHAGAEDANVTLEEISGAAVTCIGHRGGGLQGVGSLVCIPKITSERKLAAQKDAP